MPALTAFNDELLSGTVSKINPFLRKLLLVMAFHQRGKNPLKTEVYDRKPHGGTEPNRSRTLDVGQRRTDQGGLGEENRGSARSLALGRKEGKEKTARTEGAHSLTLGAPLYLDKEHFSILYFGGFIRYTPTT